MTMRALGIIVVSFLAISVSGQTPPDFTGHWREQTSSKTQRQLEVEQKGQDLRVKTAVTNSDGTLEVKYVIGGPETTYRGLDGDEFRSTVRWNASSLVFDTIEQEGSTEIPQKAVWTLSADANELQVNRQFTKSGKTTHSLTTYIRQP